MPAQQIITEITAQRRGSKQRIVVVDHDPWRQMASEVVRALDLRSGEAIDLEAISRALLQVEPRLARERALRLLNYRERTSAEVRSRLIDDGYPASVAQDVVDSLLADGLIDDERFADVFARSLVQHRALGRTRALRTLTRSGVGDDLAIAALDAYAPEDDELERAIAVARSIVRRGDSLERLAGRLGRRGFSAGHAFKAARTVLPDSGTELADPDLG